MEDQEFQQFFYLMLKLMELPLDDSAKRALIKRQAQEHYSWPRPISGFAKLVSESGWLESGDIKEKV